MSSKSISIPHADGFHLKFCRILYFLFLISIAGCKKGALPVDSVVTQKTTPFITFIQPANDSANVSTDSRIYASFSQAMDSTTITTSDFILRNGNINIPGTVSYSNKTAVFIPDDDFSPNATYTGTITTGVKNLSGISLKSNFIWNFTTGDAYHYEMTQRSTAVTDFARDGTKMMQMGDYIYSYGGWTADPIQTYNDVYRSNGNLSTWTKMPDAPWHGRHTFGIAKPDSTLYVIGGDYQNNVFDVWSSTDGITWEEKNDGSGNFLGNRILYGACSHNGKLYILGGQVGIDTTYGLFTDVWSSVDGKNWSQIATNKNFLGKNVSGASASFNGKIWVIGGGLYDYSLAPALRFNNEVWNSVDGINWQQQPTPPWPGRQYTNVCVWDNKLWMIGGTNGSNLADIWYLKKNGTWTQFTPPPSYIGRHATAVAVFNDQLVITCGNYNNDCWVIEKL